ncbi:Rv1733c family protein [Geodermatophilus sp. SYSU D01176]
MAAEVPSPAWRRVRAFTLGRGPLKRSSDRLQFAARLVLVLLVLVSVPVALTAGTVVHEQLQSMAERQAAERIRVTAVALEDARPVPEARSGGGRPETAVRWAAPDGSPGEGRVWAPAGTRAGDTVDAWTTADGRPAATPLTTLQVMRSTIVLVGLGWAGSALAVGTAYAVLCWALDRQRDRRWTREWAAIEPTWSRRVP